ncbi:beta strand repeat-containing protein, partial [Campylobacter magnus]
EDKALASAWVESLYNNLAGRASDAEGLDFWTNAIVSFTMTPAQVAASFAAALALQGNTTEDGQNFAAKLGVADNFTANFKDFNSLVTANEKAEQLKNLVTMMNGVNKDSQVDQYTQEITKITDEYQKIAAVQFTAADDDNLGIDPETGESNLKGAANFTGTYNLTDAAKGTIQSSDSATGTEAYLTDTLTINVTGYDKTTHDTFDLGELPSTSSIEKLVINNGAATVSGSISGDFEYINVNGTGSFDITASAPDAETGLKDVSLNSAAKTDNTFTATNTKVASFKSAAGNDTITLGEVSKSLNTGAGDDTVSAILGKNATADLGAGDDTFNGTLGEAAKLNAGAGDDTLTVSGTTNYKMGKDGAYVLDKNKNPIVNASIEIDGGTGTDTLDLSTLAIDNSIAGNGLGIKSIRGIENIKIGTEATLTASAISGQKIELSSDAVNSVLTLKADNGVDLSKISKAANDTVDINVNSVKSGNVNLSVANTSANTIKETVTLAKDANKVSVKSFEKSYDKIAIDGVAVTNVDGTTQLFYHNASSGKATGFNANSVAQDTIYFVNLKDTVSKTSINNLLKDANKFADAMVGKSFYIVATDSTEVPAEANIEAAKGQGKNSTAKIYKVEVGKDGKVGKVDQMATVNVADKAQLSAVDFGANTPATSETVDTKDLPVTGGELDISTVKMSENKAYVVDLSTNPDVANITSVKLPADISATELTIVGSTTAKPAGAVAVSVPANAVITKLTLGSTADTTTQYNVTVAAGAKINEIVTNNADNNIDISAVAPENAPTIIDAGQGIDTLVIANNAAVNLTTMKNIENLQYSGTKLNADAIMTNAESGITKLTVENTSGEDGKALEIVAGANTQIDLSSLVQKAGTTNKAALEITGFKTSTGSTQAQSVKLTNTTAESSFAETVKLDTATGITVTNIGTGDKLSAKAFGTEVDGAFKKGTTLADKEAFYTTAATAAEADTAADTAAKAFSTVNGQAILAVNVGNEARIYAVTGAAEKKGTYKLVAIVDNKIDENDAVTKAVATPGSEADTTITFAAPGISQGVFKYSANTINLATGQYGSGSTADKFATPLTKADSISINDVSGTLKITDSASTSEGVVNVFAQSGANISTSDYANIKTYVGGYANEDGSIVVSNDEVEVDANIVKTDKTAIVNTKGLVTVKATVALGTNLKLDLGGEGVDAQVKVTDGIKLGASSTPTKVADYFLNAASGDTIEFKVDRKGGGADADADKLIATTGKDIISLVASFTDASGATIDLGADEVADVLDATNVSGATSDTLPKLLTVENAKAGDTIKLTVKDAQATLGSQTAKNASGTDLKTAIKAFLTATKGAATDNANKVYLVNVTDTSGNEDTGTYLYYSKAGGESIATGDQIVKLVGTTGLTSVTTDGTTASIVLA